MGNEVSDDIFRAMLPISFPVIMTISFLCVLLLNPLIIPLIFFLQYMRVITITPYIYLVNTLAPKLFPEECAAVFTNLRKSFPVTVTARPAKGIYLFHPHGYMAASIVLHTATRFTDWPVRNIKCAVIPGLKYYLGMPEVLEDRFVESNYSDMKKLLTHTHSSLAVSPGGLDEMVQIRKKELRIKLLSRKGVFRLAIETGTPLVPVLIFGETELCNPLEGSLMEYAHSWTRMFRIPLVLPSLELCMKWLSLRQKPLDTKCVSVIGKAVEAGPARDPTEEEIYDLRAKYIEGVKKLYAETKPADYAAEMIIV